MVQQIDEARLEQLMGKAVGDVAGAMGLLMAWLGDQAGLYATLERLSPTSAEAVASNAGADARYVREWLSANAAAGYVSYDPASGLFSLTPEQAAVFAHDGEPTCMQGFFQAVVSQFVTHQTALDVLKSGRGRPWGEHDNCLFCGTDRFFRPGYMVNLVSSWIPALDGVEARLRAGGKVADIGCGHGSSTLLLAEAYPQSQIHGYDFHAPSIETARQKAAEAGAANARFDTVAAKEIAEQGYDLACIFDALHDMGDPVGAARHVREILKPGGTFMVVEPLAGDALEENCHPLGGIFYGFSTVVCVPCSRSQETGLGLGAQAGEKRLTEVLREAGFTSVRRAAETPTNMVLEARA